MTPRTTVYLDGTDLERGNEAFMRFRLTYSGPLLSSNPLDPLKRIEHKHDIRRRLHPQLKELWRINKSLIALRKAPGSLSDVLPPKVMDVWRHDYGTYRPLWEILAAVYPRDGGYNYVPLVWAENHIYCSLRVLCLRRDHQDAVLPRDIDNRIKTLIDALTMPKDQHGPPLKNGQPLAPQDDETPFFVLLDDDRQVTHLEVETDTALETDGLEDESFVRLIVTVDLQTNRAPTLCGAAIRYAGRAR